MGSFSRHARRAQRCISRHQAVCPCISSHQAVCRVRFPKISVLRTSLSRLAAAWPCAQLVSRTHQPPPTLRLWTDVACATASATAVRDAVGVARVRAVPARPAQQRGGLAAPIPVIRGHLRWSEASRLRWECAKHCHPRVAVLAGRLQNSRRRNRGMGLRTSRTTITRQSGVRTTPLHLVARHRRPPASDQPPLTLARLPRARHSPPRSAPPAAPRTPPPRTARRWRACRVTRRARRPRTPLATTPRPPCCLGILRSHYWMTRTSAAARHPSEPRLGAALCATAGLEPRTLQNAEQYQNLLRIIMEAPIM